MNVTPLSQHPLVDDDALRQRLLKLAYRWASDRAEAEDMVQETYLRTAAGELPESASGREAWLVTVLHRLCIDAWRRQGRYQSVLAQELVSSPDAAAWEPAQQTEQNQRVEQALALLILNLEAPAVAAVILYEVFGFGHAELGNWSGRNETAARQQMHRWLQRLRGAPTGGAAAVALMAEEEYASLFAVCSQALAQREPAGLIAVLRTARPQMSGTNAALALSSREGMVAAAPGGSGRPYHLDALLAYLETGLPGWRQLPVTAEARMHRLMLATV